MLRFKSEIFADPSLNPASQLFPVGGIMTGRINDEST